MTDEFTDVDKRTTSGKLMGNKSVTEIVNFNIFDTSYFEVTVKAGTNIANKERITCFGDEDMRRFGFRSIFKVIFYTVFDWLA